MLCGIPTVTRLLYLRIIGSPATVMMYGAIVTPNAAVKVANILKNDLCPFFLSADKNTNVPDITLAYIQ